MNNESNNLRYETNNLGKIELQFYPDGKVLMVMVMATGPGLSPDDQDLPEGFEDFRMEIDQFGLRIEAIFPDLEEVIRYLEDIRDSRDAETLLSTFVA